MSQLSLLWKYQQSELELAKLNKEMKSSQAYKKRSQLQKIMREQQDIIKGYETKLEEQSSQIVSLNSQLEALLHDYDLEHSELESMESDDEVTVEELTESRKSIEKLVARINSLNKDLGALIEWCDKIQASITDAYAKGVRAKKDYDTIRTVCDAEKESFAPKIETLEKQLEEIKSDIPDELMNKYQTLKMNHPAPISILRNGQCGGCFVSLPSVVQRNVADETKIVRCENCGRILYIPKE
ncbi:MAG: hypothetical protein IKS90_07035 [Clostridia bacterium]|nr:hypothetical protein [Clostridia bacterium]